MQAVFLDRDGTLIEDRGHIADPQDIHFLPSVFAALRKLSKKHLLFIVTQQSGVSQGILSENNVRSVNQAVERCFASEGIRIEHIYCCPHDSSDCCACKKPSPFFLIEAARAWGIDLASSYVIGDHPHDVEMAAQVNARGIYVLTGHGRKHLNDVPDNALVVRDIGEASDWIDALSCHENQPCLLESAIQQTAETLRLGGIAVFPTETVYGIGACALNENAIARIYRMKNRPATNPLIVHEHSLDAAFSLTKSTDSKANLLASRFWPGPLTLVLPAPPSLPLFVTAGLPSVAVRVPGHPIAREVIRRTGMPVAAPSANASGSLSPVAAEHASGFKHEAPDIILNAGSCRLGIESTIVSLTAPTPRLLRQGAISAEEIQSVIGEIDLSFRHHERPEAPGMLQLHYAPQTPLFELPSMFPLDQTFGTVGVLTIGDRASAEDRKKAAVSMELKGSREMILAGFYETLHDLDKAGLDRIVVRRIGASSQCPVLSDRIQRAASTIKEIVQ